MTTSDRDRLADTLKSIGDATSLSLHSSRWWGAMADKLIAEGVRMPARAITDPAELELLPAGTVVIETGGDFDPVCPAVWLRFHDGEDGLAWEEFGSPRQWDSSHISLPVRVLHIPIEIGGTE